MTPKELDEHVLNLIRRGTRTASAMENEIFKMSKQEGWNSWPDARPNLLQIGSSLQRLRRRGGIRFLKERRRWEPVA